MFFQNEISSNPLAVSFGTTTFILAPVAGWFADVKFGRYNVINFASFITFFASISISQFQKIDVPGTAI